MAVLPIYLYGSDVLRKKAEAVGELDNETIKLIYDMTETMQKARGIGLAATQVGEMKRVITIDITGVEESEEEKSVAHGQRLVDPDQPKKLVLINPEIHYTDGLLTMEEGCLSIPDVRADVDRPERIKIRFHNANFEETILEASALLARVIQHEIDHLDGVLFTDRVSGAKTSLLRAKLRKIKRGEVEASYPVVTAVEV